MNYIFCLFALFAVPFDPSHAKGLTVGYNSLSCAVNQQCSFLALNGKPLFQFITF